MWGKASTLLPCLHILATFSQTKKTRWGLVLMNQSCRSRSAYSTKSGGLRHLAAVLIILQEILEYDSISNATCNQRYRKNIIFLLLWSQYDLEVHILYFSSKQFGIQNLLHNNHLTNEHSKNTYVTLYLVETLHLILSLYYHHRKCNWPIRQQQGITDPLGRMCVLLSFYLSTHTACVRSSCVNMFHQARWYQHSVGQSGE